MRHIRLTKKLLLSKGINEWEYAQKNPYISYFPGTLGRNAEFAKFQIVYPGHPFPDVPWWDYGCLSFSVSRPKENKDKVFSEVCNKFLELYGSTVIKTPAGSWMNPFFVTRRNTELEKLFMEDKK